MKFKQLSKIIIILFLIVIEDSMIHCYAENDIIEENFQSVSLTIELKGEFSREGNININLLQNYSKRNITAIGDVSFTYPEKKDVVTDSIRLEVMGTIQFHGDLHTKYEKKDDIFTIKFYVNNITITKAGVCYYILSYQITDAITFKTYLVDDVIDENKKQKCVEYPLILNADDVSYIVKIKKTSTFGLRQVNMEIIEPTPQNIIEDNKFLIFIWRKPMQFLDTGEAYFRPAIIFTYDWNASGIFTWTLGVLLAFAIENVFGKKIGNIFRSTRKLVRISYRKLRARLGLI